LRNTEPQAVAVAIATPAPRPAPAPPPPAVVPPVAVPAKESPRAPERPAAAATPRPAPRKAPEAPTVDQAAIERQLTAAERSFDRGDFTQAVFDAKAALRLGAGARAHLVKARAHLADDEPEEAAEAYAEALKLEPNNTAAAQGLARARARLTQAK
jgi:tetratricopeptide (TPR) repeat protein